MKTVNHNEEIISTRKGGFGGSDAAIFYKIGRKGLQSLTNTDKKRIRVAKGIDEYMSINPTPEMQRGHDFEDWFKMQPFAPIGAERERKISKKIAVNFNTFFHADFATDDEVWELKCVKNTNEAEDDYWYQLQWQHLIAEPKNLFLVAQDSGAEFGDKLFINEVKRDEDCINALITGIELLDEEWNDIDLTILDEWSVDELLPFEQIAVIELHRKLQTIKRYEDEAAELKARLLEIMQANGVKSIKSDLYTITFVPESETRTFDKSAFKKSHPEINLSDFDKVSQKKSYITVKLK